MMTNASIATLIYLYFRLGGIHFNFNCESNYCFIVIVTIRVINDVYVFMVIIRVYFLVNEDLMSFKQYLLFRNSFAT